MSFRETTQYYYFSLKVDLILILVNVPQFLFITARAEPQSLFIMARAEQKYFYFDENVAITFYLFIIGMH